MDTREKLNREFSTQDIADGQSCAGALDSYRNTACNYARMENAIAVLSDLHAHVSYLYYGGFAQTLGIDKQRTDRTVSSIWEEEIFQLIHPQDLSDKHLQELCFLHFIRQQPKKARTLYYLMSKLRMKTQGNHYMPVLHRMFYVPHPSDGTLWLALCLYSPLLLDLPAKCLIVNSVNGHLTELEKSNGTKLLSERETQILGLIDKGLPSKEIAQLLSISIHTVSRHRQEILSKLQVKNSIEACRTAKDLKLI
ncbi:MAG: response regulator transcription factor [Parabacteroides sp.]